MDNITWIHETRGAKLAEQISEQIDGSDFPTCMEAMTLVFGKLCETVKDHSGGAMASEFKTDLLNMMMGISKDI